MNGMDFVRMAHALCNPPKLVPHPDDVLLGEPGERQRLRKVDGEWLTYNGFSEGWYRATPFWAERAEEALQARSVLPPAEERQHG